MILINLFIDNSVEYELFDSRVPNDLKIDTPNMDEIRKYIIGYLPKHLKEQYYSISTVIENNIININVYFDYNKNIIRDLKITKVLND